MTVIAGQVVKLSGSLIRVALKKRHPSLEMDDLADTTIETKFKLIGDSFDLIIDTFSLEEIKEILSPVVPSSLSHKRWVKGLETPHARLKAFRTSQ